MLAPEHTLSEIALPTIDARVLARRVALPAVLAGVAVATLLVMGGRVHALASGLTRGFDVQPVWAAVSIVLECASLAAYVWLLSLIAGRATPRIGIRESAQITLAGAAATRLLPTAGAGGAALTVWALRRTGLTARAAARTLLAFLVVLYSVFLVSIVLAGGVLALGVVRSRGPVALSAIPALAALIAVVLALLLSLRVPRTIDAAADRRSRLARAGLMIGEAVRDALGLVRSGSPRLAGAIGYWAFDAGVLLAMLHTFGAAPSIPIVVLAYFVGQVSNTVPIPGSVSGGMTGALVAFGVPLELALPSVLAYRTLAVWLPLPVAIAAFPGLRANIARWEREDSAATASDQPGDGSQVTPPPLRSQTIPTTVPVPACPGFGPYPGSTWTSTTFCVSPEITGPDFVTSVETTISTAAFSSTLAGGLELLPGRVVHSSPHAGVAVSAKPLNDAGARPPLRPLSFHHCAPQNVTLAPMYAD